MSATTSGTLSCLPLPLSLNLLCLYQGDTDYDWQLLPSLYNYRICNTLIMMEVGSAYTWKLRAGRSGMQGVSELTVQVRGVAWLAAIVV